MLRQYRSFILPFLLLCAGALILLAYPGNESVFLSVNGANHPVLDVFFKYFTHLGDGLFFVAVIILLLFVQIRYALLGLIIYICSSQIAQFLKRIVFPNQARPRKYFEGIQELHFVDGVTVHNMMSFPSGHTTSAFALAFFAYYLVEKRLGPISASVILVAASVVAYSRMYLAQHFFQDIFMGALIGVFTAILCIYFVEKSQWYNRSRMKNPLQNWKL